MEQIIDIESTDAFTGCALQLESAKDALAVLDPIRGTVGKDAILVARTSPEAIEIVMYDAVRTCGIEVTIGKLADECWTMSRAVIKVDLDKLIEAVKSFGDETVRILATDRKLVILSKAARRVMPLLAGEVRVDAHLPDIASDVVISVPVRTLRRVIQAEAVEDTVTICTSGTRTIFKAEDDTSRDTYEVFVDALDPQPEAKSSYGLDLLKEIIPKIHLEKDNLIVLSYSMVGPCKLTWSQGKTDFDVLIAHRTVQ